MSSQLRQCRCKLLVTPSKSNTHCRCCMPSRGNWRMTLCGGGANPISSTYFPSEDRNQFLNPWEDEQNIWLQANSVIHSSASSSPSSVSLPPPDNFSSSLSSNSQHDIALGVVAAILAQSFTSSDIIELILAYTEPPFIAGIFHQELAGSDYFSTLVGGKQPPSLAEEEEESDAEAAAAGRTEIKPEYIPNNASIVAWSGLCSSFHRCVAKFDFSAVTSNSEISTVEAGVAFDFNPECSFFQLIPGDLKWDNNSSTVSAVVIPKNGAIDLHRLTVFYTVHRARGFSRMLNQVQLR